MKLIYKTPIPEVSQPMETDFLESQLAEAGILDGGDAVVEQLASEPAAVDISGQYRFAEPAGLALDEPYAKMVAAELEELADSPIDNVPIHRTGDSDWGGAGYYEIDNASVEPAHPNAEEVCEYTIALSHVGTRATHYRAVEPHPRQIDHEWGNDLEAVIGAPAETVKAQWFDPDSGEREPAAPFETLETEFGDVALYDLESASWYDPAPYDEDVPTLLYQPDYGDEAPVDCRVYDTRGHDEKYHETDDGRVRLWQSVYKGSHDFADEIVLDNGLTRLRLDEAAGTLEVEHWDPAAGDDGEWSAVGLKDDQPIDVELFDADITEIGMVRDQVQLTFDVDGDLFALDAVLERGAEDVLFAIPDNESGPIPESIEDWLKPVASEAIVDTATAKTVVSRSDVRR